MVMIAPCRGRLLRLQHNKIPRVLRLRSDILDVWYVQYVQRDCTAMCEIIALKAIEMV